MTADGLFISPFCIIFSAFTYICRLYKLPNTNLKQLKMAYVITDDCTACGSCIDECPVEAIAEGDIYKIDPEICTDCGACADVCPVEAIHPE
jgi:ferredoxin